MKVIVKRPRRIGGKVYHKGQHHQEIPAALESDKYVQHYLKAGDMVKVEEPKQAKAEVEAEAEEAPKAESKKKGK